MPIIDPALEAYAARHSSPEASLFKRLARVTPHVHGEADPEKRWGEFAKRYRAELAAHRDTLETVRCRARSARSYSPP